MTETARPLRLARLAALAVLPPLLAACPQHVQRRLVPPEDAARLDARASYLKVHLRDGRLYVLEQWRVDDTARVVTGTGQAQDALRHTTGQGSFTISLDSVALFETDALTPSGAGGVLAALTVVSAGVTIACLASLPKGCFGSCPTFSLADQADLVQAEGFSASVSPALEATDIDALYRAEPVSRDLTLRMTNEALETHVVRYVDLLAARRPRGGRVFKTMDGAFREGMGLMPPVACAAAGQACEDAVRHFDGLERWSHADSTDLASRETIELSFDRVPSGDLGLVVAARQTLLTTFLFYQSLAYLGRSAGTWLAALERGGPAARDRATGMGRALGRIEVMVQIESGDWMRAGDAGETGPIATDVWVIPLPRLPPGAVRLQLRLTRGLWRIDYLALARLGAVVSPTRLPPLDVRRRDGSRLGSGRDTARTIITLPGDEVRLHFRLPEDHQQYELFLETRGYYLEWMREQWLAEEDLGRATVMFTDPPRALRELARPYKVIEADFERAFWSSRYVRRR